MTMNPQDNVALAQQMYMSQKKETGTYLLLALLLGGLGAHHFYLGKTTLGIIFLVFCITCVPAIIAIFNAINNKKHVQEANIEIAKRIALSLNVPEAEIVRLAMI